MPDYRNADTCQSMADLREAIDHLDRDLVALLAVRQTYIERAGVLKPTRDTVRDEARIADVVAKVRQAATQAGLSDVMAERVWRTLIEASIEHEFAVFDTRAPVAKKVG